MIDEPLKSDARATGPAILHLANDDRQQHLLKLTRPLLGWSGLLPTSSLHLKYPIQRCTQKPHSQGRSGGITETDLPLETLPHGLYFKDRARYRQAQAGEGE